MNPRLPHAPRAVLFDLYGTLVYEAPPLSAIQREMAARLELDPEAFARAREATVPDALVGRPPTGRERAASVLRLLGEDPSLERAALLAEMEESLRGDAVRFYEGAADALRGLRGLGFRLGLVSNGTALWEVFVERLGLEGLFDVLGISHRVGVAKPDPALFRYVADRLGVPPAACVYVGDGNDRELSVAHDLGMHSVLVRQPGGWATEHGVAVDHDTAVYGVAAVLDLLGPLAPTVTASPT